MDISKLRKITNAYSDVRLISLKGWKFASDISPCEAGGPYIVAQEGCAPDDLTLKPDEFVLGRSGKWFSTAQFFALPLEQRRAEFIFGTVGEVIQLLAALPPNAAVGSLVAEAGAESRIPQTDELHSLFQSSAKQKNG